MGDDGQPNHMQGGVNGGGMVCGKPSDRVHVSARAPRVGLSTDAGRPGTMGAASLTSGSSRVTSARFGRWLGANNEVISNDDETCRGCSSVGRALESHSRGRGFDSLQLHHCGWPLRGHHHVQVVCCACTSPSGLRARASDSWLLRAGIASVLFANARSGDPHDHL